MRCSVAQSPAIKKQTGKTMKRKILLIACLAGVVPALSGCAFVAKDIGKTLGTYDEPSGPATSRVAPLVVPPDFALTPTPAVATRQDGAQEQTLDALFGGPAQRSTAERALTGTAVSEPGIRSSVGDPKTVTVNKGGTTREIMAAPEGDGQYAQAVAGPN